MQQSKGSQKRTNEQYKFRANDAIQLRRAGATYQQIADKLGYGDASGAFRAIQRTMKRMLTDSCEDCRKLEAMRLDQMHMALWPQAMKGHLGAIDKVLKIMERRAKLFGLDMPTKTDTTFSFGEPVSADLSKQAGAILDQLRGAGTAVATTEEEE